MLTKAELDEIRASHTDPLKGPKYLTAADSKPVLCHQRIHALLDYIGVLESAAEKMAEALELLERVKQDPNVVGDHWVLHRSGGCRKCRGWGRETVFACGDKCPRTDHRGCGERLVKCQTCGGSGLGLEALRALVEHVVTGGALDAYRKLMEAA